MRRALLLALALLGALPAAAQAATVELADGVVTVTGRAATGERLTLGGDTGRLVVAGGATAGAGCAQSSSGQVACTPGDGAVTGLVLRLGDVRDVVRGVIGGGPLVLDAAMGGGDDELAAAAAGGGTSVLRGDADRDRLTGGPATDRLEGGEGADVLIGGAGPDVLAGGAGDDLADYRSAPGPLRVTVDGLADDGLAGEGDSVEPDVERVWGGESADVLAGSPGPDGLNGFGGADRLVGGAGADLLDGGLGDDSISGDGREPGAGSEPDGADYVAGAAGNDVLEGGAGVDGFNGGDGDDRVLSRDPVLSFAAVDENLACGAGTDAVTIDWNDSVGKDCEGVDRGPTPPGYGRPPTRGDEPVGFGRSTELPLGIPAVVGGRVVVPVSCPARPGGTCRAELRLTAVTGRRATLLRRAIGRDAPLVAPGAGVVSVRVNAAGRALVRRYGTVRARATLRLTSSGSAPGRHIRPLRITAARLLAPTRRG